MSTYINTAVPKSLQVNQNTSTTRYKVSGEELYILSSSLTAVQSISTVSEGNENGAFYTNLGTGFGNIVTAIAVQDDNRIVVGGEFIDLNGNTRNYITRLNIDGTEDESFYSKLGSGFDNKVKTIALQPDGKIIVGGSFTDLGGNTRNRLVRLNDIEDLTFYNNLNGGFDGEVLTVVVQPDGKILVGGNFTDLGGNTRNYLVRLNSDGTEDTAFYTNLGSGGFNNTIYTIEIQPDGRILVGGAFTSLGGNARNYLVRLNTDGSEDTSFYTKLGSGFNDAVRTIKVQSNGKILVGGKFITYNGNTRNYFIRLYSDGTEDNNFYTNLGSGFGGTVFTCIVQPDEKIVVGGEFTGLNGNTRNKLVQLNSDGTEEPSFYASLGTGFNGDIYTLNNDKIFLVGGDFGTLNGNTRNKLVDLTHRQYAINNTTLDASSQYEKINLVGVTQINGYANQNYNVVAGITYNPTIYYEGVNGELAYWGGGNVTEGVLYYLRSTGNWEIANANDPAKGTKLLAIAAGTGRAYEVGMLLKGHARFPGIGCYTGPDPGKPLYLSTTGGEFAETAPTATGDIVRIVGYVVDKDLAQIYFCPDNTWVEN